MKKSIKYAVLAVILLAIVAGSVYYVIQPVSVRMTEMVLQNAELSFTELGVVVAENTMLVFSGAQGEMRELYVREGQNINAGDAILSVDTTALRLRLTQVESGIVGLEAQLANIEAENANSRRGLETTRTSLQGELAAINAQAAEAERGFANQQEIINEQLRVQKILIEQNNREIAQLSETYERILFLYESGVVARTEYEAAQAALSAAQARLEAAEAQLAVIAAGTTQSGAEHFEGIRASLIAQINGITAQLAGDTLTAARANIEALISIEQTNISQIEHELQNATVTAPASGIITTLHAQNTNFISAATPVAEITTQGNMYIEAYVSTQDTGSIHAGDIVRLTLRQRTGDIIFNGTVEEIGNTAVVRHTALGVEERKVNVRISPQIPEGVNIGVGYGVDVTFYIYRRESALTVPRTAVFRENGRDMVWISDGGETGTAQTREVVTGLELRTEVIIESGLQAGEFVINDANNRDISNGSRVTRE
ncbi:MAG: HlyD family efflux transporter periplasmic adaptor subunit [Defluviitaleaceae bacterium]|nr:HlyD family efflux transporter periplasmic adaptor subunit [Defluviitaleaceae bacterium]MCL2262804.1 HlyD family efflux transporter periplasmic adaptor subunit [Defluviitaleaceae bacterium]